MGSDVENHDAIRRIACRLVSESVGGGDKQARGEMNHEAERDLHRYQSEHNASARLPLFAFQRLDRFDFRYP